VEAGYALAAGHVGGQRQAQQTIPRGSGFKHHGRSGDAIDGEVHIRTEPRLMRGEVVSRGGVL
jgi:hypothetical protein